MLAVLRTYAIPIDHPPVQWIAGLELAAWQHQRSSSKALQGTRRVQGQREYRRRRPIGPLREANFLCDPDVKQGYRLGRVPSRSLQGWEAF